MIISAYNYLFFRIYDWQQGWWDSGSDSKFFAALAVSLFLFINVLTLFRIVPYLTGYEFPGEVVLLILIAAVLGAANVYYFLSGDRALQISKRYSSETAIDRRLNLAWCWYYIIMTKLVFITTVQTVPMN